MKREMDDVLGQVVLARRREDLVPDDGVGAVVVRGRGGLEGAHVRARLWLGQEHGPGPFPRVQLLHEEGLLLLRPEGLDELAGAMRETAVHQKGEVRRVQVACGGRRHRPGHPLPAPLGVFGEGQPLALSKGAPGAVERLGDGHVPVVEAYADAVAIRLGREDLLDGERARLGDDQVDHLAVELGEPLVFGEALDLQLLVKDEIDISSVCENLSHGSSSELVRWPRRQTCSKTVAMPWPMPMHMVATPVS